MTAIDTRLPLAFETLLREGQPISAVPSREFPSMCDYSLHHVASRPAKVGDKLVTTQFNHSITRGFASSCGVFQLGRSRPSDQSLGFSKYLRTKATRAAYAGCCFLSQAACASARALRNTGSSSIFSVISASLDSCVLASRRPKWLAVAP